MIMHSNSDMNLLLGFWDLERRDLKRTPLEGAPVMSTTPWRTHSSLCASEFQAGKNDRYRTRADESGTSAEPVCREPLLTHAPVVGSMELDKQKMRSWDWSTPGVYMWRKPSSVTSSSQTEFTTVAECTPTSTLTVEPHFLSLPVEIVLLILSFLKQSDLATCMLVCRRIYWIGAHRCLWKSVSITKKTTSDEMMTNISWKRPQCLKLVHSVGRISNSVLQRSFMRMASLQELTIDTCNFGPFTGDQLLICASIHCHELQSLDIRWIQLSDRGFRMFSENCRRLKRISLESIPLISLDTFYLMMATHRNRLTHVRIKGNMSFSVQDLTTKLASTCITLPNITSFTSNNVPVGGRMAEGGRLVDKALNPSEETDGYWVSVDNPVYLGTTYGKWLVFRKKGAEMDSLWHLLHPLVTSGQLGATAAKCSTARPTPSSDSTRGVVCVYTTREMRDTVGATLVELLQQTIRYKSDEATLAGLYAHKGHKGVCEKTLYWKE